VTARPVGLTSRDILNLPAKAPMNERISADLAAKWMPLNFVRKGMAAAAVLKLEGRTVNRVTQTDAAGLGKRAKSNEESK
jgi:hypothetical protein